MVANSEMFVKTETVSSAKTTQSTVNNVTEDSLSPKTEVANKQIVSTTFAHTVRTKPYVKPA